MVKLAEIYECLLGRFGDKHLTVSNAFREDIISRLGTRQIKVLYDLPVSARFKPLNERQKIDFLGRLGMTELVKDGQFVENRPLLLIT